MKLLFTIFTMSVVLIIAGSIFYGAYLGVFFLWDIYTGLDTVIRIVLLSSMAALLTGSIIVAGAIKAAAQDANKGHLMSAKLEAYISLVALYQNYLSNPQQSSSQDQSRLFDRFLEIEPDVLILSSGQVLSSHRKLQAALRDHMDRETITGMFQLLIRNIRRDLGHGQKYDEQKLKFLESVGNIEKVGKSEPGVRI